MILRITIISCLAIVFFLGVGAGSLGTLLYLEKNRLEDQQQEGYSKKPKS